MSAIKNGGRKFGLLALIISAFYVFLILRLPIWVDEAFTIQQTSLSIEALLSDSLGGFDAVHLLYYLICWPISLTFYNPLFALRLLSVLATLGTIRNIYIFTSVKIDSRTALVSAGLFGLFPVTVDFATQARSTALVTYLISFTIQIAIRFEGSLNSHRFYLLIIISCFFVTMNITALIGYFIFAIYLIVENQNYFFEKKKYIPLFAPLLLSLPTTTLAIMQKNQVAWISSHNQSSDIFSQLVYWPFLESERTIKGYGLVIALVVTLIAFVGVLKYFKERFDSFLILLCALATIPPISLQIFSTIQPLFLTRYFAYGSIGASIVCGFIISTLRKHFLRIIILSAFGIICCVNITSFSHNRAGHMDWDFISKEVKNGPRSVVVVVEPGWASPLASYYFEEFPEKEIIGGIPNFEAKELSGCKSLPKRLWLVSTFERIERRQVEDIANIGYSSISDNRANGLVLFDRKKCDTPK